MSESNGRHKSFSSHKNREQSKFSQAAKKRIATISVGVSKQLDEVVFPQLWLNPKILKPARGFDGQLSYSLAF